MPKVKISYSKNFNDSRYDYKFYNKYGSLAVEKRQVFSLVVLLITLLSNNLEFPPFLNRREPIDRDFRLLLEKIEAMNISSYTRAIIIGALNYREFEKQFFSIFDEQIRKRDDDTLNGPIVVEKVDDLKNQLSNAQKTLDKYQLSLENQTPRQMVPISLANLSRKCNPYAEGSDNNDEIF